MEEDDAVVSICNLFTQSKESIETNEELLNTIGCQYWLTTWCKDVKLRNEKLDIKK